jgi:hypothetical protein
MKASSVLLALAAAGLSAVMTAPASAQVFKPRDQTCDNKSTARDKTLRPDTRCLQGGPGKEKAADEQSRKAAEFLQDPQKKIKVTPNKDGSNRVVISGTNGSGVPYRIVTSGGKIVGYGSAAGINPGKGGGGGKGQR